MDPRPQASQPSVPASAEAGEVTERPTAHATSDSHAATDAPGPRDDRRTPLAAGTQLRQFRIVSLIGQGGMGMVYEADDASLRRRVAVKVPQFRPGETLLRERFLREARLAGGLTHPNLCPIYEVNEAHGLDYLVMPLIEGESLAAVLRRDGPLPPRRAAGLVARVARGMDAAHQRGVVHRDLKPGNIMLDVRGEPIVMDFGLARSLHGDETPLTKPRAYLGTPAYSSPEQVQGEPVDGASDIFSLGVVLYELLIGKRPFEGSVSEVVAQVVRQDPDPPHLRAAHVDPLLSAICLKALAKRAAARYASCEELACTLEAWNAAQHGSAAARSPAAPIESGPLPATTAGPGGRSRKTSIWPSWWGRSSASARPAPRDPDPQG